MINTMQGQKDFFFFLEKEINTFIQQCCIN